MRAVRDRIRIISLSYHVYINKEADIYQVKSMVKDHCQEGKKEHQL
jgi:predicted Ser/Thr protein kinase